MVSESEMYVYTKRFLRERGWTLLGGEPPGGSNELPRIEIKDPNYKGGGSKGSKKVDLVAYKDGKFLLLELKPEFDQADVDKLNEIVGNHYLRKEFLQACKDRKVFWKIGKVSQNLSDQILKGSVLIKGVGLGKYHKIPKDFIEIVVRGPSEINVIKGDVSGLEIV